MPEGRQISPAEVAVFKALNAVSEWATVKQIAASAGVARKTADIHLRYFLALEIADRRPLYGGYLWRPAAPTDPLAVKAVAQINEAALAFAPPPLSEAGRKALVDLRAFRQKYRGLGELAPLFAAMDKLEAA